MRVLDACAAPGGKTTHLAELAALDLTAIDIDARAPWPRGAEPASGWVFRRGWSPAMRPSPVHGGTASPFDRILADVPCTASGVVRRHPDIKWLRRESDIAGFVDKQRRLLDQLWTMLAGGGRLLYSTCSVFRAENAEQLEQFLARHADASRVPLQSPGCTGRATTDNSCQPRATQSTITTGFSTPSCRRTNLHPDRAARRRPWHVANEPLYRPVCASTASFWLPFAPAARGDTIAVKSAELRAEDENYVLNAQFDFAFNPTLEEALQKGVSLYFVLEFELSRPRWYWLDEKVVTESVQYRISYSPLTRQYRVATGLLGQQFESLDEVEHLLSRVVSRPVIAIDALTQGRPL